MIAGEIKISHDSKGISIHLNTNILVWIAENHPDCVVKVTDQPAFINVVSEYLSDGNRNDNSDTGETALVELIQEAILDAVEAGEYCIKIEAEDCNHLPVETREL